MALFFFMFSIPAGPSLKKKGKEKESKQTNKQTKATPAPRARANFLHAVRWHICGQRFPVCKSCDQVGCDRKGSKISWRIVDVFVIKRAELAFEIKSLIIADANEGFLYLLHQER